MAKKFKVTLDITTKDDFEMYDIQRYFHILCNKNGDLESYKVKTEVKEDK